MNMTMTQAADECRKLLKGIKAVDMIAEALEMAGSIENASKEAQFRLDSLNVNIEKAKADLIATEAESADVKSKMAKMKSDTKASCDKAMNLAEEKEKEIEAAIALKIKAADDLCKEAEEKRISILDDVKDSEKELADLESKINKAKAYIAKLQVTE